MKYIIRTVLTSLHMSKALLILFACTASLAHAGFENPIGGDRELGDILDIIVQVVIFIAFPLIVLMLVYTGFLFVQAQGNPAKIAEAKKVFMWTLIGAFIILAAETLKDVVVDTVEEISAG